LKKGKSLISSLKQEDFPHVAQRLALTEYYSQFGKDPQRAQGYTDLEASYAEKPGPIFKVTHPEGDTKYRVLASTSCSRKDIGVAQAGNVTRKSVPTRKV